MFKNVPLRKSIIFQGQTITLQTGLLAKQATSSVIATIGETTVMINVVIGKPSDTDYFPLQVIYEEKMYASGKIRGSRFEKREGKPSDNAVLIGRAIDRSLRSLFDDSFRNSVQVIVTALSIDETNTPDIIAIIGASAALCLATNDFQGPVSGVRAGLLPDYQTKHLSESLLINPTYSAMSESPLDIVISGNGKSIVMVEAGAYIIDEELISDCIDKANIELGVLTNFQREFVKEANELGLAAGVSLKSQSVNADFLEYWSNYSHIIENIMFSELSKTEKNKELLAYESQHRQALELAKSYKLHLNEEKRNLLEQNHPSIAQTILNLVEKDNNLATAQVDLFRAFHLTLNKIIKNNILNHQKRVDGRNLDETRKIECQIDILPRVHGSSLFQRGETQVMNILTLGTLRESQTLDGMEEFVEESKQYIHHYNFPSYSVGETGRYGSPGRREIGHGALAEKALVPVLPSEDEFPYTIRLVSECLGSNGSTSMASTCGSTLSLMAAGVPIKDMVAGVAMGVIMEDYSNPAADYSSVVIETENLIIKTHTLDFVEKIFEEFTEEVAEFLPHKPSKDIQFSIDYINKTTEQMKKGKCLDCVILDKKTNEFVGKIGIFFNDDQSISPGIWLKKSSQGNGYGLESMTAILNWARTNLRFPFIMYRLSKQNQGSLAIAKKLNFEYHSEYISESENNQSKLILRNYEGAYLPRFQVLTDIQGLEDHHGDMDFKVTGTKDGITAIQLDNKVSGLTPQVLKDALIEAKKGRMHILGIMKSTISTPKDSISEYAPGVERIDVPFVKIGDVIGSGGKIIRGIEEKFGTKVDLENETGRTYIYGKDKLAVSSCKSYIASLIKDYQVGDIVEAKIARITAFGAFCQLDGGSKEGMIHISKVAAGRVEKIEDVLSIGQSIPVKVVEIKDNGNISLSVIF